MAPAVGPLIAETPPTVAVPTLKVARLCGFTALAIGPLIAETPPTVAVPTLKVAAGLVAVLGLVRPRRAPGARLGRYTELFEVLLSSLTRA